MNRKLLTISQTAQKLNITTTTLRRWDKSGQLKSIRHAPGSNRYYYEDEIELLLQDIFALAKKWILSGNQEEPVPEYFCVDSPTFQTRLNRLEKELQNISDLKNDFSLITSMAGEIGNNSFDHNIGSWPDIRGIFFAYDLKKRQIALADRGQGILATLRRVRPQLTNDAEALEVAFTEKLSGRAPESRGNGLKYVRKVIVEIKKSISIKLYFQSGSAAVNLNDKEDKLDILNSDFSFRGCLALINF